MTVVYSVLLPDGTPSYHDSLGCAEAAAREAYGDHGWAQIRSATIDRWLPGPGVRHDRTRARVSSRDTRMHACYAIVIQAAAQAARYGHRQFGSELRGLVDAAKERSGDGHGDGYGCDPSSWDGAGLGLGLGSGDGSGTETAMDMALAHRAVR